MEGSNLSIDHPSFVFKNCSLFISNNNTTKKKTKNTRTQIWTRSVAVSLGGKIIGMHREVQSCTADYFLKKLTRLQDCNNIRRLECTTKTTLSKKKKTRGEKWGKTSGRFCVLMYTALEMIDSQNKWFFFLKVIK